MKHLLPLLTLFIFCLSAQADVTIAPEDHIKNLPPGRCAWAALETLGRTHGWSVLRGLRDRNNRSAQWLDMIAELDKDKVKYQVQWPKEGEYFYYLMHNDQVYAIRRSREEAEELLRTTKIVGSWWVERKLHWNTHFLRMAAAQDLGCVVSLNYYQNNKQFRHIVVLTHIDDDKVLLIDSEEKEIQTVPLATFLWRWNGFSIMLEKK